MKINKKFLTIMVILVLLVVLSGCGSSANVVDEKVILFEGGFFDKFIVYPIGWLMLNISKLFGNIYAIGLIITTIIIRTIGWPIYAKTNDMSFKMQIAQPELTKLQEKYAGRKDPDSQRQQQSEMMAIYKKYNINPLGCLLPFAQMPIFLGIFYAIRRIPLTVQTVAGYESINANFLWTNLFEKDAFYILPIFVAISMFFYQRYSTKKTKQLQDNVPDYRKNTQQQSMQKNMQIMMYFMIALMVYVSISYPSGIALYWTIGNIFSLGQMVIGRKLSEKKLKEQNLM